MDVGSRVLYSVIIPAALVMTIAVEGERSDAASVDALVQACSSGIEPKKCVVAAPEGVNPSATVTWISGERVDLAVTDANGSIVTRTLVFRSDDPEAAKWRATGLVVASLSGRARQGSESAERASRRIAPFFAQVGALAGTGLRGGPPRFGGWLRVAFSPSNWPLFVSAGGAVATSGSGPDGIGAAWLPLSVGVGALLDVPALRLSLRPRVDGLVVHEWASLAFDPSSAGRWLDGLGFSISGAWPTTAPVRFVFEGGGTFLSGGTGVRVDAQKATSFPARSAEALVGIEVPFPE